MSFHSASIWRRSALSEQGQVRQTSSGVGGGPFQQDFEVDAKQAGDGGGVEEIAVVLAPVPGVRRPPSWPPPEPASGRTWPCGCPSPAAPTARPGSSNALAGAFCSSEHDLEQRRVREVALRPQLLDQLLERQVLVGVARPAPRPAPGAGARSKAGSPDRSARSTRVLTKSPTSAFGLDPVAVGDRRADRDVAPAGAAREEGLEGGEQGHEQAHPLPAPERFQPFGEDARAAPPAIARRGRSAPTAAAGRCGSSSSAGAPFSCLRQ